jgi:hypothetical protein
LPDLSGNLQSIGGSIYDIIVNFFGDEYVIDHCRILNQVGSTTATLAEWGAPITLVAIVAEITVNIGTLTRGFGNTHTGIRTRQSALNTNNQYTDQ